MPTLPYREHTPTIGERLFLAPTAYLIGEVTVGDDCSLWFGATVRGDSGAIQIGSRVNIQESSTVHSQRGFDTVLGSDVSLGHHTVVHAAVIDDNVLIGMNASVLTGARVGTGSIIAAHALVSEGTVIPPRSLVVGVPGRVTRETTDAELDRIRGTASTYLGLGAEYLALLGPGH